MITRPVHLAAVITRPIHLTAAQIAAGTGGRVVQGDPQRLFRAAALDSRDVPPGSLFIALPRAHLVEAVEQRPHLRTLVLPVFE